MVLVLVGLFGSFFASPALAFSYQDGFDNLDGWTVVGNGGNGVIANGALRFSYGWGEVTKTFTVPDPSTVNLSVDVYTASGRMTDSYAVKINGQGITRNNVATDWTTETVSYTTTQANEEIVVSLSGIDNGFWWGWYGPVMDNLTISATTTVRSGLDVVGYNISQNAPPRVDTATPNCSSHYGRIYDWPSVYMAGCRTNYVMLHYTGYITVPVASAQFLMYSDDGSYATIGGQSFGYWGLRGCSGTTSQTMSFTAGESVAIDAWMYEWGGGECFRLYWNIGNGWEVVPESAFTSTPPQTTTTTSTTTTTTLVPYYNPVRNLTATANENGSVSLSWDEPQASNTEIYGYSINFVDFDNGVERGGWGVWTTAANTTYSLGHWMFDGSNPVTTGYGRVRFKVYAMSGPCAGVGEGSCLYGPSTNAEATVLDPTPPTTTTTTTLPLSGANNGCGPYRAFTVTGTTGGTVWGSGPYTDDSAFGAAAVHAGLIQVGQTAVIEPYAIDEYRWYDAGYANGVHTNDWHSSWCGYQIKLLGSPTPTTTTSTSTTTTTQVSTTTSSTTTTSTTSTTITPDTTTVPPTRNVTTTTESPTTTIESTTTTIEPATTTTEVTIAPTTTLAPTTTTSLPKPSTTTSQVPTTTTIPLPVNEIPSIASIAADGYSKAEAKQISILATSLAKEGLTAVEAVEVAKTVTDLADLGIKGQDAIDVAKDALSIQNDGYTKEEAVDIAITASELKDKGYSAQDAVDIAKTSADLQSEGYDEKTALQVAETASAVEDKGYTAEDAIQIAKDATVLAEEKGLSQEQAVEVAVDIFEITADGFNADDAERAALGNISPVAQILGKSTVAKAQIGPIAIKIVVTPTERRSVLATGVTMVFGGATIVSSSAVSSQTPSGGAERRKK
jgi:hypothetical protein